MASYGQCQWKPHWTPYLWKYPYIYKCINITQYNDYNRGYTEEIEKGGGGKLTPKNQKQDQRAMHGGEHFDLQMILSRSNLLLSARAVMIMTIILMMMMMIITIADTGYWIRLIPVLIDCRNTQIIQRQNQIFWPSVFPAIDRCGPILLSH